jgi:hypothetical protein
MKQITIFVIFVLVTGMMMSVYDDVFALSDKGQEKGKATGCEKGTAKNNPHCNGSSLPENACDADGDGAITSDELGLSNTNLIKSIETTVSAANGDTNSNLKIDTLDEWNAFQIDQPGRCTV